MRPSFEQWASHEIAKLRSEADALQRSLDRYLAETGTTTGEVKAVTPPVIALQQKTLIASSVGRPSKHEHIRTLLVEAGPNGLSNEEIEMASRQMGHAIKRDSLRSYLWSQRKNGNMLLRNGRNVSVKFENEGEPEGGASGSPSLFEGAA